MATTSGKKSLLGKFVDLLSGKPSSDHEAPETPERGKFAPKAEEPVDLLFVRNFTNSGGKFLYCEDHNEVNQFIENIIQESGLHRIYCEDQNLKSILHKSGIEVATQKIQEADSFCCSCEYLVSYNGGIMITARQTQGKKLDELPETFIIIARTSQITENLRSALAGIRTKYQGNLPSQITTIKGPVKLDNIQDSSPGPVCNKEIYLLLLEDQL